MPKAHHENLLDLPADLAAHVASLLPGLCRAVVGATAAEAFNVIINNGSAAGQTVFHGHWHVIPRRSGDAVRWPWPHQSYPESEIAAMQTMMLSGSTSAHEPRR